MIGKGVHSEWKCTPFSRYAATTSAGSKLSARAICHIRE